MRIAIVTGVIVTAGVLGVGASACKKKITAQQCDEMVSRYVELAMKEKFPDAGPEQVAAERARVNQEARAADELKNCASEVTPDEHSCAMKSPTSDGLIKCLE
jgi:hypothetical protein